MEFEHLPFAAEMDSQTFDELMLQHGQDVWNYAFFITRDRHLTDDITQEVFLRAYRGIQHFRGQCTVKTWLLKMTRNQAYSTRRSAFYRRVFVSSSPGESQTTPSAESAYFGKLASDEIWHAVMTLPLKFREVLLLEIKSELSMKEIADMLGVSEGTAKSRLHRARARVTAKLEEGRANEHRKAGVV
ncbi:RNA polymerase sigma factor [Gorillibacterium massiliense]|uniref:RNA polymerase sigma factor n=1 Tax=Gorillibacterium massiliense TaxID=1280390 RepID=UPI0004B51A40|nr:sigma-70 family RNA polymerase sigma factor [Gorillibacterium massiliense]